MIKNFLLILTLLSTLTGCSYVKESMQKFDFLSFRMTGKTLFKSPKLVTMKQIHLGRVGNLDTMLMIKGKVEKLNPYGTYMVLSDKTAKMVVALTEIIDTNKSLSKLVDNQIEVIGSIERGPKGMPFLKAASVRVAKM